MNSTRNFYLKKKKNFESFKYDSVFVFILAKYHCLSLIFDSMEQFSPILFVLPL